MILPYWYKILIHFQKKGYFVNGLTLPYLIGARTILEPGEKLLTVRGILNEINNIQLPVSVTLIRFNTISEYLVGLIKIHEVEHKHLFRHFNHLLVSDHSFPHDEQFDVVCSLMEIMYQPTVDTAHYSKIDGTWGAFSKDDLQHLSEVK
jgi:hypothetical protein